jgi:hypothetical protein
VIFDNPSEGTGEWNAASNIGYIQLDTFMF